MPHFRHKAIIRKKKLEPFSRNVCNVYLHLHNTFPFSFSLRIYYLFPFLPSSWCPQTWVLYFTFLLQCFEKKGSLLHCCSRLAAPDYILSFSILFPHGCFLNLWVLLELFMFSAVLSFCLLHPHVFFGFLFCTPYLYNKVTCIFDLSLPSIFLLLCLFIPYWFIFLKDHCTSFCWCKCLLGVGKMQEKCFVDLTWTM